jgi:GNAT superfamily N-acetyltransferase
MQATIIHAQNFWGWKELFYSINKEWLEDYFSITPADHDQLSNPQRILDAGGSILLLLVDGVPVGTVALVKESNGNVEIAKMGIYREWRGKGLGEKLLIAAIAEARKLTDGLIYLETVEVLQPAIRLYEKFGFVRTGQPHTHPKFGRTTFRMELK